MIIVLVTGNVCHKFILNTFELSVKTYMLSEIDLGEVFQ